MKLTATVVVELGSVIALVGSLLLARLNVSPEETEFLRALVIVILGLFFIQIGYAQYLREKLLGDLEKRRPPGNARE